MASKTNHRIIDTVIPAGVGLTPGDEQQRPVEPRPEPADEKPPKSGNTPSSAESPMRASLVAVLVLYSVLVLIAALYCTYAFCEVQMTGGADSDKSPISFIAAMSVAVFLGTAMGAVHNLASLSWHAGRQDLCEPWLVFYLCRPFTGAGIALITAVILMSGVAGFSIDFRSQDNSGMLSLMAWSALAGLYSQPALDKLSELFETLFGNKQARKRKRPLGGPRATQSGKKITVPGH